MIDAMPYCAAAAAACFAAAAARHAYAADATLMLMPWRAPCLRH